MSSENKPASVLLAAMADGIGDLTFASAEWVGAAGEALSAAAALHADGLKDLGRFTLCYVGHNPPAYLHGDATLSWHATFNGSTVDVRAGELPAAECDLKVQADHSILSNMARLQHHGKDPGVVAAAKERLAKLSKWEVHGKVPEHKVLEAVLRSLHDTMAVRTMPRFVFMTPEWVSSARYILSTRATSEKYADGIRDVVYTFSEEFGEGPHYAFPDGSHGGFWVHCNHGQITVGAGPLPREREPADKLTKGVYIPVVPIGRTVNRAMTEGEQAEKAEYDKTAFRFDKKANRRPVTQSSPSGKGEMPDALSRIFMPLHDELSKRTSGELPADFDTTIKAEWAAPLGFDRSATYDPSWVRYDKFDIYGEPIR
ncbi:MAG: hypothetical protein V3S89_04940 [Desulfobacterales bacterium]